MCHVMHTQCIIMGAYFLSNMSRYIQMTENIQGETEGMVRIEDIVRVESKINRLFK